jgi:hypothetical protein
VPREEHGCGGGEYSRTEARIVLSLDANGRLVRRPCQQCADEREAETMRCKMELKNAEPPSHAERRFDFRDILAMPRPRLSAGDAGDILPPRTKALPPLTPEEFANCRSIIQHRCRELKLDGSPLAAGVSRTVSRNW